ncbi:MAG: DUF4126 domain-containing protein [Cyanobacteria bacterium P01_H01_bin.15]
MLISILAVLAASAAAGIRIALPLLMIGLLRQGHWWSEVPLMAHIHPRVLLAILISWSLFELFGSKHLIGQRILQIVDLVLSPVVGACLAIAIAKFTSVEDMALWLLGLIGGLVAFLLKLVTVGWFFRLQRLPYWAVIAQDFLCLILIILAFEAPQQGGLLAMLLLWLALRSANAWKERAVNYQKPN